jgi:choline dehydrogenase-like flavoprotein
MTGSFDYDVIVVGTGFGGGSAAESLARAGLKVGILERGMWWGAFGGHRPTPETLLQLVASLAAVSLSGFGRGLRIPISRRGLLDFSVHAGSIVVNSSVVGGNSVVSGALLQRPASQFFDALPPELTESALAPHYARIERELHVSVGPQHERRVGVLTASPPSSSGNSRCRLKRSAGPATIRRPGRHVRNATSAGSTAMSAQRSAWTRR